MPRDNHAGFSKSISLFNIKCDRRSSAGGGLYPLLFHHSKKIGMPYAFKCHILHALYISMKPRL